MSHQNEANDDFLSIIEPPSGGGTQDGNLEEGRYGLLDEGLPSIGAEKGSCVYDGGCDVKRQQVLHDGHRESLTEFYV